MQFIPYYSILAASIAVLTMGLGFFVLSKNPRSPVNKTYFYFCLEIIIWLVPTSVMALKIISAETMMFLSKIVYIGVAFMPTTALHFTIEYLDRDASPEWV